MNNYLTEFRRAKKLSIEELAKLVGVSVASIRKWEEEGIPGNTTVDKLYYYSVALDCSVGIIHHFSELQKAQVNKQ